MTDVEKASDLYADFMRLNEINRDYVLGKVGVDHEGLIVRSIGVKNRLVKADAGEKAAFWSAVLET